MPEPTLVKDLLDLPETIRKGDFVLKLSEGVNHARETAQTYVVTPAIEQAFDKALSLVGSALRDNKSQAAYLHGSFGSGKSHFMALLSLLLAGNEEAWRLPELHPLRDKVPFVGKKNLLELHFHMVGKESIEAAVFSEYLAHVQANHPDAELPALFGDDDLFRMAADNLEEIGDDKFFAPLNAGAASDSRWGKRAAASQWNRERFERAIESTDEKERAALFSALVKNRYKGWGKDGNAYVSLDEGLGVLSRHAAGLGYDAVILFLDELILWLAARGSDSAWLHNEAQKMVKLVEAEDMDRPVPLISFIARQRDLADMVGEEYAGAENARLRDSLKHWEGRYDKVTLEDRNLPAIVEKRVIKPKGGSREPIHQAFGRLKAKAGASWGTLLGTDDAEAFEKLYPFSPALVDVLVSLSNSLQRQRTAIKILMEMLVDHIEDLEVGEVVCVGDLFDLLAAGEDAADGMMKHRFDSAKQIYKHQLLPLIQEQNGTKTPERCQRLRKESVTLGCSNCPERACRTDNRLAKTLLIAALVPETEAVKDLTAARLVQLNHGSLKVPIAGTEAQIAAQKLRTWASAVGQLVVGPGNDPTLRLRLEGVDPRPILAKADHADTAGNRQRVVRDVLFEALGLEKVLEKGKEHVEDWRGTKRRGHIQFGNVRTMGADVLRCRDDNDWRLVIDYPFDEGQYGPNDDLEAIERFRDQGEGSWTVVWLPSFFSDSMEKLVGELVRLEEILQSKDTQRKYVQDLSVENQSRALSDLENMRSMKKARLLEAMGEAYGLRNPKEGDLDSSRSLDQHVYLLKPGAKLATHVPPNMAEAVKTYVRGLLDARYPRHPKLGKPLTKNRIESLVERFGEMVDDEQKRLADDKAGIEEMRVTLGELGLVRVTETAVFLVDDQALAGIERRRMQKAEDSPTVGQVKRWYDETGKMGLLPEAEDLVVRCYARWQARTFEYFGKAYQVQAGKKMPDDVVLAKPELPGQVEWSKAVDMAGTTLGVSSRKALNADNLQAFETSVNKAVEGVARAAGELPRHLGEWAALVGVAEGADRLVTATSADQLVAAVQGQRPVDLVNALAQFEPKTSGRAVGAHLAKAQAVRDQLGNRLVLGVFQQLASRKGDLEGAAEILERAAEALRQDEFHVALAQRIQQLAHEGQKVITDSVSTPSVEPKQSAGPQPSASSPGPAAKTFEAAMTAAEAEGQLASLAKQIRGHIETATGDSFVVRVTVEGKGS